MLGNVVTGLAVLGPAGMLATLADGLHVGIRDAGLLVTYGAVVLCIGSPLIAWLTTRFDRRALLVTTLALVAFFQAASALAPDYATVSCYGWRCWRQRRSIRRRRRQPWR